MSLVAATKSWIGRPIYKTKEEGRGLLRTKKESTQTKRRSGREAERYTYIQAVTSQNRKRKKVP